MVQGKTNSQFVTHDDIDAVTKSLEDMKAIEREIDLAEKAGNDVTAQREALAEARKRAMLFLQTYKKIK
jgi:hypothetical protein